MTDPTQQVIANDIYYRRTRMAKVYRIYWGRYRGGVTCTVKSPVINHQSVVFISASEGDEGNTTESPKRYVGLASINIENIAPFDGGVVFHMRISWGEPIPVWTDIFIADEYPKGFIRA